MIKGFRSRSVGRCLTEYTHPRYDKLSKAFDQFLHVSQGEHILHNWRLEVAGALNGSWHVNKDPRCGAGEVVYGITANNRLIALTFVVDSSD